jgi:hypothetical protein
MSYKLATIVVKEMAFLQPPPTLLGLMMPTVTWQSGAVGVRLSASRAPHPVCQDVHSALWSHEKSKLPEQLHLLPYILKWCLIACLIAALAGSASAFFLCAGLRHALA